MVSMLNEGFACYGQSPRPNWKVLCGIIYDFIEVTLA